MARLTQFTIAAAIAFSLQAPALAESVKIEGVVVTNQSGRLTIKTPMGDQTIVLPPQARVRSVSGVFGGQKETVSQAALLPGLPVSIEGDNSSGQIVANDIEYKASDYKTAVQINAGIQETARREAELRQSYSKMGEWEVRAEKNVYFKSGSAAIAAADKKALLSLAEQAKLHKGYVVSVLGFADPQGDAAANERLSNRRAQTVINYLKQSGHLLPGRVLSASAMGEMKIPVEQASSASNAQARRVTVRVLTSAAHLNQ